MTDVPGTRSIDTSLRSYIAPNINRAIEAMHHPGDDLMWDITYSLIMSPDGSPALQGMFICWMKSPIIGEGHMAGPVFCEPTSLKDPDIAGRIVLQSVSALRDLRAQKLAPANGRPPQG